MPGNGRVSPLGEAAQNIKYKQQETYIGEKIDMKIRSRTNRKAAAFTLIEMIGVLAVIAILAAVLIPKVFEAINNSRINNAAMSVQTVKTALADHYAKFGSIASSNSVVLTTLPNPNFDVVLLNEGFLDKLFTTKIGITTNNVFISSTGTTPPAVDATSHTYDLNGDGTVDTLANTIVVDAVITGCTEQDAKDLNDRIDGIALGTAIGTADTLGRVKYDATSPTTAYIYITHR
jgi:type II secretory pathway pseudopilin PulG